MQDAGGLQVEQFFLRDLDEEHSLLLELSDRMKQRPVLVTFNGKVLTGRYWKRATA